MKWYFDWRYWWHWAQENQDPLVLLFCLTCVGVVIGWGKP